MRIRSRRNPSRLLKRSASVQSAGKTLEIGGAEGGTISVAGAVSGAGLVQRSP